MARGGRAPNGAAGGCTLRGCSVIVFAALLPGISTRRRGVEALATACRACDIHPVCGGGLYAHRYDGADKDRVGGGYANPSVYCRDLYLLITHIRERMTRDIAALV